MDGVSHHVAARASKGVWGICLAEASSVRACEGMVHGQLKGGGGDTPRELGLTCFTSQIIFFDFHGSSPKWVIASRGGFPDGVSKGVAIEGKAGGVDLKGVLSACKVPLKFPLVKGAFPSAGFLEGGRLNFVEAIRRGV